MFFFQNSALHEYFSAIGASNIDVATVQRPETIESTKEPYICTAVPMPSVWVISLPTLFLHVLYIELFSQR